MGVAAAPLYGALRRLPHPFREHKAGASAV